MDSFMGRFVVQILHFCHTAANPASEGFLALPGGQGVNPVMPAGTSLPPARDRQTKDSPVQGGVLPWSSGQSAFSAYVLFNTITRYNPPSRLGSSCVSVQGQSRLRSLRRRVMSVPS